MKMSSPALFKHFSVSMFGYSPVALSSNCSTAMSDSVSSYFWLTNFKGCLRHLGCEMCRNDYKTKFDILLLSLKYLQK